MQTPDFGGYDVNDKHLADTYLSRLLSCDISCTNDLGFTDFGERRSSPLILGERGFDVVKCIIL
jgi:hypothetical protein